MKTRIMLSLISFICYLSVQAQAVYVDSNIGDDNNKGTEEMPVYSIQRATEIIKSTENDTYKMKLNPGVYILDSTLTVETEKDITNKRIVIEASILPEDTAWTPEQMPVIISNSRKGKDTRISEHFVVSFLVESGNVTIRGLKFSGYFYPNTRYLPVARFNKEKTDLLVEQCMFVGDEHSSVIQVGVLAHGDKVKINRCVFNNVRNAVVFWEDSGNGYKIGNSMTNCIVNGAAECAVWTCTPDKDFVFENNIVTNSKHFWIINSGNPTAYSMNNCVIVDNQIYKANWEKKFDEFKLEEHNVIKDGDIHLRFLGGIDEDMPRDYLHIIPDSLGHDIGAGLFTKSK